MTSNTEEQIQKIKKTPLMEPSKKAKPKNNSQAPKNKTLGLTLAFLIALGALGTAAYTFYQNQQLQNQLINTNNSFSAQIKELEQKQNKTQEQIKAKTTSTDETQKELQTKFKNLTNEVQSTLKQRFYQNQDWLLLKARYYLDMAQINAHWNNNFDSTTVLLEQADQILKQVNDPKIFNIRQALAKDIAQIQKLPRIDTAGILSQLDALQNSVNDLNIPLPGDNSETTTTSTSPPSAWHLSFKDSMSLLQKLVVIRHHDQNIKPLMSPVLEALIKEKLQLNLQEAQWAVLNNNTLIYKLVLNQIINNVKTNFNANSQNTNLFIKKLTELQQIDLKQEKPVIDSALPMLNELIDANKNSMKQAKDAEQGGNL